jgi:hypothetical protein
VGGEDMAETLEDLVLAMSFGVWDGSWIVAAAAA